MFPQYYFPGNAPDARPVEVPTMDVLRRGAEWLRRKMTTKAAQEIEYIRGAVSYTVPATFGRFLFSIATEYDGPRIEWSDKDFLVNKDDLSVTPQRGDTIEYDGDTYEVNAPGDEPCWRWTDAHEYLMRIHTKKVTDA